MAVYVLREPEACFAVPGVPEDTPEEMLEAICRQGSGRFMWRRGAKLRERKT